MLRALVIVVLLLALFAAATLWRAARREAQAEAEFPPEGQLIDVGGVQVHAVVMGQGPDLVLIHGSSGNTRDMTFSLAPRLAERYRVIVFDRPGLGYTDSLNDTGETLSQQVDLLTRAAAQLGADRPIVMGQSLGGAVALAWAVEHPQALSALVLVSAPSHEWPGGLGGYYSALSHPVWGPVVATLITAWVPQSYVKSEIESVFAPQSAPKGYADRIGAGLTLRRASLLANARQRAILKPQIVEMSRHYDRITVPVESLHGTADDTVYIDIHSERLARDFPDRVHFTPLPGIGHMPHHVAEDAVVAAIDRAAERAED